MGCGSSKDRTKGHEGAVRTITYSKGATDTSARFPLLDTPEEQAERFLMLCNPPSPQQQQRQKHRNNTVVASPPYPNLLAVELRRVYAEVRQRVFQPQVGAEKAMVFTRKMEQQERPQRVHGRHLTHMAAAVPANSSTIAAAQSPPPPLRQCISDDGPASADARKPASTKAIAVNATDEPKGDTTSTPQDAPPVLPLALQCPTQEEFSVHIKRRVAPVWPQRLTAYDVVEAAELFVGYVKHDLYERQAHAYRENTSKPEGTTAAAGGCDAARRQDVTLFVPWMCQMRGTLSGDAEHVEKLLNTALQQWKLEREASHLAHTSRSTRSDNKNNIGRDKEADSKMRKGGADAVPATLVTEPIHNDSSADIGNVEGGRGLLFIDAAFENAVPGGLGRRIPWQVEIVLYLAS